MKRILSILLIICMLASFGVTAIAGEESEVTYIDVTDFSAVTTGAGYNPNGNNAYNPVDHLPHSRLIDGNETDGAGFYFNVRTGYMYIDLARPYKIHHIEVVAYDPIRPLNCAEYNLIATNTLPDLTPYDAVNPGTDLLVATPELDANATTPENGTRTFDVPETDEEYRYVSFEQLTDKGDRFGLLIQEVRVFVDEADMPAEEMPEYVDVTDSFGVTTGAGYNPNGNNAYNPVDHLPYSRLIDENEDDGTSLSSGNCGAGFYYNVRTGYMYVDLRREYKIHHIEVVAYDPSRPKNCSDYNLIVTNTLPDLTPYNAQNPGTDLLVATPEYDAYATTALSGKKRFDVPETDNTYRYVSFEQLWDKGDRFGLLIQEVRVYVDKNDIPEDDDDLFAMTDTSFAIDGDILNVDYTLFNGSMESVVFGVAAYNASGALVGFAAEEEALDTYVDDMKCSSTINIATLPKGENIKYSFTVFDNLEQLTPLIYVDNIISADAAELQPSAVPNAELDYSAEQKGKNAVISGKAPGSPVVALILNPGKDIGNMTTDNADEYIAYLGYVIPDSATGEFTIEATMPESGISGSYSVVLSLVSGDTSVEDSVQILEYASMIDSFKTVTADNFVEKAEMYKDSYVELYADIEEAKTTIGNSFVITKDAFATGKLSSTVTDLSTVGNIITVMEASVFADKTINGTEFSSDISGVADTMPLVFNDKYVDADEFETLVNKYKSEVKAITAGADLAEAYGRAAALSAILVGTREDIVWAMTNFPDALGIDLDAIEDAGVSLNDIAKKISNTSDSVDGYLRGGMDSVTSSALGELTKGEDDDDDVKDSDRTSSKVSKRGSSGTYPSVNAEIPGVTAPMQPAVNAAYNDMQGYEWAADAVATLTRKEIVNGVGDGSFAPYRSVTREEAAKLIVLTFGFDSTLKTNDFADCVIDTWYYPFVTAASANGIVKGVDRKTFGVGSSITRQDMAVMIDRAFMVKGIGASAGSHSFADSDTFADYAKDSIMRLSSMGVVTGLDDGSFAPYKTVTRAEAAAMLYRALGLLK